MIFLALYYLIALIVVLTLCAALYARLGRYDRIRYVAIPVYFIVSVLLIPMPIHGGFTIFGEVAFDGVEELLEDRQEAVREQLWTDWHESFKERLPEAVSIAKEIQVNPSWNKVILTDQTEAWLDVEEGLVWRAVILGGGGSKRANLIKACGRAGSFTLPLEIELSLLFC